MQAAVIWGAHQAWSVEEVDLDGPQSGEILVSWTAAGPLDRACVLGCGITTGWGSAVHTANVRPGDTVVVVGVGGIGAGAIQRARIAGAERILAIDLVPAKQKSAELFGATDFVLNMAEALGYVRDLTRGAMANSVILTVGLVEGSMIAEALDLTRKGGATVVTGLAEFEEASASISLATFALFQKRLLGSLFGQSNPRADIPRLIGPYRSGHLLLDEVVAGEYALADINIGYDDMLAGKNIRGILNNCRSAVPGVNQARSEFYASLKSSQGNAQWNRETAASKYDQPEGVTDASSNARQRTGGHTANRRVDYHWPENVCVHFPRRRRRHVDRSS